MLASSGEVHGVLGIIVDLNCLGQRLGVPTVTLARHMAAFSTERQRETGFNFDIVKNDKREPLNIGDSRFKPNASKQ